MNILLKIKSAFNRLAMLLDDMCKGDQSGYTTFEKLVYCGVDEFIAAKIECACERFRMPGPNDNDNVIIQCAAAGIVYVDDMRYIFENYPSLIIGATSMRKLIHYNGPMKWSEFVEHLRLDK